MGSHYVPQHYLRHFAAPNDRDKIWMYDNRHPKKPKLLPIVAVAQSSGFYTDSDERALSQTIEGPAQRPLNLLRNGQHVDSKGRNLVALYLDSMINRVPSSRDRLIRLLPSTKEDVIADTLSNIETVAAKLRVTPSRVAQKD